MAAFAIAFDAFDLALDPHDACTLCNLAQIRGIKRGVEMKGMGDAVEARVRDLRQPREAVRARRRFVQRIVAEHPRHAIDAARPEGPRVGEEGVRTCSTGVEE